MIHPVRRRSVLDMEQSLHLSYSHRLNTSLSWLQLLVYVVSTFPPLYIQSLEYRPKNRYKKQTSTRSLFCHGYILNERRQRTLMQIRHDHHSESVFPNNSSARSTVIVQIAEQEMNGRSSWLGLCLGDPSRVYVLVTMSPWTFCLHVLVYITTLIYINIYPASWV